MRKIDLAIASLALAGALTTAGAQASAEGEGLQDFSAIAKVTQISTHGESTGIFREQLKVKGHKIGTSKLKCRFTKRAATCSARWRLRDGVIKAKGRLAGEGEVSSLRIKRGTGAYMGAEGKVRIESVTERRNKETFDFK